jgi:signal transduction histidine kinase
MIYPLISNGVEGAVIRLDDVTDRVRIEQMMIQTEKMMSVGGLAAGMAHEINNPLGAIMQGVQNAIRRVSPDLEANRKAAEECGTELEAIRGYLEKRGILRYFDGMREAGSRAAKIVSNMLNFSRRSESKWTPTEINELIDSVLELADSDYHLLKKYDFRHVKIVREYGTDLSQVPCTATEIEQVFLNLIRNAAEAMTEIKDRGAEPRITIRTRREKDHALIEIEDNGPGMDEETRKRVFEPFFTTKSVVVGTGLGLSVSYFIITNNHNGTISVESEPGKGTTFIIRLPLERKRS